MVTCTSPNCIKPILSRGLCSAHYTQARKARMAKAPCSFRGCSEPTHARGLCQKHYRASTQDSVTRELDRVLAPAKTRAPEEILTIRISSEALARLQALAQVEGVLPTRVARRLLMDALKLHKKT